MDSRLTALQREVLQGIFRGTRQFVLTGGGALAGYHLGHRDTKDLDLFTVHAVLDEGDRVLRAVAAEFSASLEETQTAPDFRRRVLRKAGDFVVVDLVRDPTADLLPKEEHGGVLVDSAMEILANKLCAVLGRSELRDLVDLRALEGLGLRVEDALPLAAKKDGGATPGQLSWLLGTIRIGSDARIPGGVTGAELQAYLSDLSDRLARLAAPPTR